MELGQILRELREKRNISIINLANEVGVSSSHISQIERNLSSPSISMLKKIAKELEVPITYFFNEDDKSGSVIRKSERKKLIIPNSNVSYEMLSPSKVKEFQLLMTRIEVGGVMGETPSVHGGGECCLIVKGTVEFMVDGEKHILHKGDSIYFPENAVHNATNIGSDEVIIVSVISPAEF